MSHSVAMQLSPLSFPSVAESINWQMCLSVEDYSFHDTVNIFVDNLDTHPCVLNRSEATSLGLLLCHHASRGECRAVYERSRVLLREFCIDVNVVDVEGCILFESAAKSQRCAEHEWGHLGEFIDLVEEFCGEPFWSVQHDYDVPVESVAYLQTHIFLAAFHGRPRLSREIGRMQAVLHRTVSDNAAAHSQDAVMVTCMTEKGVPSAAVRGWIHDSTGRVVC